MTQGKSTRKILFYLMCLFGVLIRMTIIGMGCGAFAHVVIGAAEGPMYLAASFLGVGIYFLGVIIEYAGDIYAKKGKTK